MKMLGYPKESNKWIWPYYFAMSDQVKAIIASVFKIVEKENTKYIIFVATNTYGIGINNPDIKLVI